MPLSNAIFKPVITQIKGFRFFHADLSMENAVSSGIVGFKRSTGGRLRMTHFDESGVHGNSLLSIEKEAASFSFRGRGRNGADGFAKNMDGAVELGILRRASGTTGEISQEKMASSTTAGILENKIGGIGTDSEDHVAGVIADGGIRMCGEIVDEHVTGLLSMFGRRGLTVRDFVERNDNGRIATP